MLKFVLKGTSKMGESVQTVKADVQYASTKTFACCGTMEL